MPISKFIEYLQFERGYSKHTLLAYKKDLLLFRAFLQETYSADTLSEVIYVQIRTWIVNLVNDGLSNRSINRKISALKSFYKFLEKVGDIDSNPLQGHHSLKTQKKTITPFSKKELERLDELFFEAKGLEQVRDHLIIELLYTTGMRRAELVGLKLSDISFENKIIKVLGKRNKERYIPLLEITIDFLHKYMALRNDFNSEYQELFLTNKGKPLYDSLVYKIVTKYFKQITTKEKKSPHVLRHAFATHLLDEGADLNVVKELLGHASLASTQIYTQSSLAHLKEVYKNFHPRNKK
ncbi:MAG TPA: integrase [Lutibacter sp.]|nr:integrase [Lutibacter sp.]